MPEEKVLSLKKNMLWNSLGSITYLGCQWLITILVVRLSSGYENAGILALAMAIGNLFAPLAIYKMRTIQISDTNQERSAGEYLAFRIITIAIAFIGCMFYMVATCKSNAYLCIILYLLYKAVDTFIDVLHGIDQQNLRLDYAGKSLILRGVFSLLSFSLMLYFFDSLNLAVASMIIVSIPVAIFYDWRKTKTLSPLKPSISRKQASFLLAKFFPAAAAIFFCSATLSIPRQYLAFSMGDTALGIYAAVAAPVVVIQMGASYIYNPLLGSFAKYYNTFDFRNLRSLFLKTLGGIAVLAAFCTILLLLFGGWLLTLLYGDSIIPNLYLLFPIIACTVTTAAFWFLNDLLVAVRNIKGSFLGSFSSFISAIPFTFLCVNIWGMNGVSFAGIFSYGIGIFLFFFFLKNSLKQKKKEFVHKKNPT